MDDLPQWLTADWQALFARHTLDNLPHALLLEGTAGIGKKLFVRHAVNTLLCSNNSMGSPCGACASCLLLQAGTHPDLKTLTPLEKESVIKVGAVRELIEWLQLTPQYHSYKIAVITPADSMNRNAANSLLKTLEEPATHDLILLTTDSPGSLPATIRSRCQRVSLVLRDQQSAVKWLASKDVNDPVAALALADNGPFLAAEMVQKDFVADRQRLLKAWQDIVLGKASVAKSVELISDLPTSVCLRTFALWVADIIRLRVDYTAKIRNSDVREALAGLIDCMRIEDWFALYDELLTLHRIDSASFKTQTVLEGIFADIRLKQPV